MSQPLPVLSIDAQPSAAAAPTLAYDDLPPGSDVRREYRPDGSLLITVPAGEVPTPLRRTAAHEAAVSGALLSAAILLVVFGVFVYFVQRNRIGGVALAWAIAFFTIFCAAIVALVAWVRYRIRVEALEAGRQQATVLAVSADRLVAETRGPFGVAGYDLPGNRIAGLEVRRSWITDGRGQRARLPHLELVLGGNRSVVLMPGRDAAELRWIAGTVRQQLGIQPAP